MTVNKTPRNVKQAKRPSLPKESTERKENTIQYTEIDQLKKEMKFDPSSLWNYLQKKEQSKDLK